MTTAQHTQAPGFTPEVIEVPTTFGYSPWRHGGWYVSPTRWPNGGCGCVSRNYPDKKWRIACDPRPFEQQPTFRTRDDAARAEFLFVASLKARGTA